MIGVCRFWQQHHYREVVCGYELQFAKYLDFMNLSKSWNIKPEELKEAERIKEKVQLGGELSKDETDFVNTFTERGNKYDIYALCFVDIKTGDEVKEILDNLPRIESEKFEVELIGLGYPEIMTEVPSQDEVYAYMTAGYLPMNLVDATVQQGLIISQKIKEMATERATVMGGLNGGNTLGI